MALRSFISELIRDSHGQVSSMRVLSCLVVLDVMATWSVCCLRTGWQDMGAETAALVVGVLTAKAWQKDKEK